MAIKLDFIIVTLIVVLVLTPLVIALSHSVSNSKEGDNSFLSKFNRFVGTEKKGGYKKH